MRFVALLAALAALWVQPATAATVLAFEQQGTVARSSRVTLPFTFKGGKYRAVAELDQDATLFADEQRSSYWYFSGLSEMITISYFPLVQGGPRLFAFEFEVPPYWTDGVNFIDHWSSLNLDIQLSGPNALANYDIKVTSVPEPATWAMMILGLGVAGAAMRGRSKFKPA